MCGTKRQKVTKSEEMDRIALYLSSWMLQETIRVLGPQEELYFRLLNMTPEQAEQMFKECAAKSKFEPSELELQSLLVQHLFRCGLGKTVMYTSGCPKLPLLVYVMTYATDPCSLVTILARASKAFPEHVDFNATDYAGRSAVHLAILKRNVDAVYVLLKYANLSSISRQRFGGKTLFSEAVSNVYISSVSPPSCVDADSRIVKTLLLYAHDDGSGINLLNQEHPFFCHEQTALEHVRTYESNAADGDAREQFRIMVADVEVATFRQQRYRDTLGTHVSAALSTSGLGYLVDTFVSDFICKCLLWF